MNSASVQEDRSQKHSLFCRYQWNCCLGNSLLGICVYLCECVWETKRERGTTQVLRGGRQYVLWDSQRHPRVRIHLSGPLTSLASSFHYGYLKPLTAPKDPQIIFILSLNTLQQFQSWKANPTPPFTTCVTSARPLLSAPQFPHMSHELIRPPAMSGCCRIKPIITWKCLEQSVNIKVCAFVPSSHYQQNEPWTAHGQSSCKSPDRKSVV